MTALVFVDTNVLLYARDESETAKRARAQAWLEHLWQERQVLSEYYVNLKRLGGSRLPADEAWERVSRYFAWTPLAADEALLRLSRQIERRYRISWWDSMVVGAAQLQDCSLLLTEDLRDGAVFGGVRVRSPFTLALEERAAVYAARPVPATRHRAPGRPRRR